MPVLCVAGAGTDIGKTYVSAALLRALVARGETPDALKPVASGFDESDWTDSDPGQLLAALGRPLDQPNLDRISSYRYAAPLSPPLAARREGRFLDYDAVLTLCRTRAAEAKDHLLLVETAGGVMSPLDDRRTMLDLLIALNAPCLLVGGSYLGAISHTLTALAVLRHADVPVAALAISESPGHTPPLGETLEALASFVPALPLVPFARNASPEPAAMELFRCLDAVTRAR